MFKALWFGILLWVATVFLLPQIAWAGKIPQPFWLAQDPPSLTESQPASDQSPPAAPETKTPPPESDRSAAPERSPNQAASAARSPYDMEALKAFDAGSHRKN